MKKGLRPPTVLPDVGSEDSSYTVPNLDLMKKGLRHKRNSFAKHDVNVLRSKPRPDEEGIETQSFSVSFLSGLRIVPNLDLMKKGLRQYCTEYLTSLW